MSNPESLASGAFFEVYPSVGADLNLIMLGGSPCRGIYVGTGGDVAVVRAADGATRVIPGVAAGTLMPVMANAILASGTTATNLTVIW